MFCLPLKESITKEKSIMIIMLVICISYSRVISISIVNSGPMLLQALLAVDKERRLNWMLESRRTYGWNGRTPSKKEMEARTKKWQVGYRSAYGGCGLLGYLGLFNSKEEALKAYEAEANKCSFMVAPIIEHPSAIDSWY